MDPGVWPTDKSNVPAFGDPLLCDKPDPTEDSDCPNHWIERASAYETHDLKERDPSGLSFRELIAGLCKSAGVSKCRNSSRCEVERQQLDRNLPRCQWKSFRDWMLEILACCSIRDDSLSLPKPIFWCICTALNPKICRPKFDGFAAGFFLPHIVGPVSFHAAQKAKMLKICLNRLFNIASASPCGEADIPTLVEAISRADHRGSLQQPGHEDCTPDLCEIACENATIKKQLHKCKNAECTSAPNKKLRSLPQDMVLSAINNNKPAIWSFFKGREPALFWNHYIAISHVWSDGTGVGVQEAGKVNPCLFDYFADIARDLGCDGIWWDNISIPTDRKARAKALNDMQTIFRGADWTVVHDEFLVQFPWPDDSLPCIAVILSSWFTRGWTALELAFSRRVKVIFKDGNNGSHVLKDLDEDVLAPGGRPSPSISCEHWVATVLIRQLRRYISIRNSQGEFLHSLALRTTSWPRDRAVIAALMAGVKDLEPGMTQAEITRRTISQLRWLSSNFLFYGFLTMTDQGSFSWCPHVLFSGQKFIGSGCSDESLNNWQTVIGKGEIQGKWCASVLSEAISNTIKPWSFHFSVDLRIKHALQQWESCLLIDQRFSPQKEVWKRQRIFGAERLCLLVVVLDCEEFTLEGDPILDCQYVGCVYEPSGLVEKGSIEVRFGRIAGKSGVSAAEMLRTYGSLKGRQTQHVRNRPSSSNIQP